MIVTGITTRPVRLSTQEREQLARQAERTKREKYTIVANERQLGIQTTYPPNGDWTCRRI